MEDIEYRREDWERIKKGSLKVKHYIRGNANKCGMLWCFIMVLTGMVMAFCMRINIIFGLLILLGPFHAFYVKGFLYAFGFYSYYTFDDERLSFIQYGKLKWSYTWDEIDSARKHKLIAVGRYTHYDTSYFDITTKNGMKVHFLSNVLEEELAKHVKIHERLLGRSFLLVIICLVLLYFA